MFGFVKISKNNQTNFWLIFRNDCESILVTILTMSFAEKIPRKTVFHTCFQWETNATKINQSNGF